MIDEILEAMQEWFKEETGLSALLDPQPVKSAEPHLRFTFAGTEDHGRNAILAKFQLSIIGAGDGPSVFLPAIIKASALLSRIYDKCNTPQSVDLNVKGMDIRMSFTGGLASSGQFTQNEMKTVETSQWSYYFTEPRYITLTIPMEVIDR